MPGRVMIIDDLATNRIILKVKLSAAYYDVSQATSVADAVAQISQARPDLILLVVRSVEEQRLRQTIQLLRRGDIAANVTPVVVLLDSQSARDRIAVLRAGAEEVLSRPLDEQMFLARLRRVMREQLSDQDLRHHTLNALNPGFADAQKQFAGPGQIGLLAQNRQATRKLQTRLANHLPHTLRMMSAEDVMGAAPPLVPPVARQVPDLFVMHFDGPEVQEGLRLFSALRADGSTRSCPIIVLLSSESTEIAGQLLDLGAGDVILAGTDLEEIAVRVNAQLALKQLRDQMRDSLKDGLQAAVIDPLTGIYNRRYALSYLKCLMQEREDSSQRFAVMVADLDYFKQINDTFGHAAGDAVLVDVAKLLTAQLRKQDMVARIGGEEFLIIVPDTSRDQARRIATDLCAKVRDTPIPLPGQSTPAHVTISIGLTLADGHGGGAETIIDRADRALYRSKAEGRDTVRFAARNAA